MPIIPRSGCQLLFAALSAANEKSNSSANFAALRWIQYWNSARPCLINYCRISKTKRRISLTLLVRLVRIEFSTLHSPALLRVTINDCSHQTHERTRNIIFFSCDSVVFVADNTSDMKRHCQWPKFQTCFGHWILKFGAWDLGFLIP